MVKRMLIDATHPEETRVVVVNGTRLEELDVETSSKKQIKGNIYLAKVVRVEPSLQAAFVEYGGNRHGFLAFSEIHPDYFQIPVADRQALLAAQRAESQRDNSSDDGEAEGEEGAKPESLGGDEVSEQEIERRRARLLRNYKIQEVIKRRQIMLVQVVKEERGNKGAALTTYLSLAGRYCVLMPNTARGGGVSRKITSAIDRRRLKSIASDLDIPDNMAVIVRTAGSERSKAEIKRDYEYLLRAWDNVRELTLKSSAPELVYEEASLIKRSIRDLYSRDIDEIQVEGEEGYRLAKDYMRMLTPSHAKKVQPYRDPTMPMFHRYQVETQLDAMHSPIVQLKSGGYIVINQTEALVAIDVNSGRSTKERHIEETAVKTNAEAADEIARQLRLRDLAGLIVIDFIDMDESRNNHAVERRLKDALKNDRARIQIGKISAFGLLELSRQRLRPSLQETTFQPCPHCAGTGLIRSVESAGVHVLRAIEEEGIRRRSSELTVHVPTAIALYILNQKREALAAIEERYQFKVFLLGDDNLIPPNFRVDRVKAEFRPEDRPLAISMEAPALTIVEDEDEEVVEEEVEAVAEAAAEVRSETRTEARSDDSGDQAERKKRRRRRRSKRKGDGQPGDVAALDGEDAAEGEEAEAEAEAGESEAEATEGAEDNEAHVEGETEAERRKRRRGRRGGRRRRGRERGEFDQAAEGPVEQGPVVFNPDMVADVFEAAEAAAEASMSQPAQSSETGTSDEKPKRRRPARKVEAMDAAAPAVVQAEALIVSAEELPAEGEAIAKPKRAPRKKAAEDKGEKKPKAKAEKAEKVKAAPKRKAKAKADTADKGEQPSGETAGDKAEPKPRAPRARKAKPAPAAADKVEEHPVPEQVVSEQKAPAAQPEPAPAQAEPTQAKAEPAQDEEAPAPASPAKRGWWNRLIS